jgi:hypothetical protein
MGWRAQGTDIILGGGPVGEFSRGLIYWDRVKALVLGTFLHRGPVKYRGVGGGGFRSRGILKDS